MKYLLNIVLIIFLSSCNDSSTNSSISGCMDLTACNYNEQATEDDGNCLENDCAGICGGTTVENDCGICGGVEITEDCGCDDILAGDCDCEGNILDCMGDCGGEALLDDCGICNGNNIDKDCTGECFGNSVFDCNGICNGDSSIDVCGFCNGTATSLNECSSITGTYNLTGTIEYENPDCTGEETLVEGFCMPSQNLDDPMEGLACYFLSLGGEGSDLVCDATPECNFYLLSSILPFSLTLNSNSSMVIQTGEFCSNPFITNEQDCNMDIDSDWFNAQLMEGNWSEENNIITCTLSDEFNNDDLYMNFNTLIRTSNNTLIMQDISINEYGEESCNSMIFTK